MRFGEKTVLDGISFMRRGERAAANGGGKSTLLRLILGILKPTSGRVFFSGTDVAHLPRRQLTMRARASAWSINTLGPDRSSLTVRDISPADGGTNRQVPE